MIIVLNWGCLVPLSLTFGGKCPIGYVQRTGTGMSAVLVSLAVLPVGCSWTTYIPIAYRVLSIINISCIIHALVNEYVKMT